MYVFVCLLGFTVHRFSGSTVGSPRITRGKGTDEPRNPPEADKPNNLSRCVLNEMSIVRKKRGTPSVPQGAKAFPGISPSGVGARMRPAERALAYLESEIGRGGLAEGARLPTVREVAARVCVSLATVQSVFRRLAREGRVRARVGDGTFLAGGSASSGVFRLALNLPMPRPQAPSMWGGRIIESVLHAAGNAPRRMMILPLNVTSLVLGEVKRQLLREIAEVDGLLLIPPLVDAQVVAAYEEAGKPVLHVNPPAVNATANFVSTDYYDAARRLGRAWRETGRRRVAFVGVESVDATVSSSLYAAGLMAGFSPSEKEGRRMEVLCGASGTEADGYQIARGVVKSGSSPFDAFLCYGDLLAAGVLRALAERGVKVPAESSVVGGTGLPTAPGAQLHFTRVRQPFADLGREAVRMMCDRAARGAARLPGRFLATGFALGSSTRPSENQRLV